MEAKGSLIQKLDDFIRAYYLNQVVNGLLLSSAVLIIGGITFALLEYVGQFGIAGRTVIFWVLVGGGSAILSGWVGWPLLKWSRLSRGLTYEQASNIIGEHFPEISDRLLNVLQLQRQLGTASASHDTSLLQASIEERTTALKPVAFQRAIDWKKSRKLLKYAAPALVLAGGIMGWTPDLVQEPVSRIIAHRQDFIPPPPFSFSVLNNPLAVPAMESFTVEVRTEGATQPDVVMIEVGDSRYRMERTEQGSFRHVFPMVRESVRFLLTASGVRSKTYTLQALPVPTLLGLEVTTTPPPYTGLPAETLQDVGNLRVPEGTQIEWRIQSKDTDRLRLEFGGTAVAVERGAAGTFTAAIQAKESGPYWLVPSNSAVGALDSMRYHMHVSSDQFPRIRATESVDSTALKTRYFNGEVSDDYGFSKLTFAYQWLEVGERTEELLAGENPSAGNILRQSLPVPRGRSDRFFFEWSLQELSVVQGDVIEYWFEIWDNDRIHGAKMSRSAPRTFSPPSEEEVREERDQANADIEERMAAARQSAAEVREDMESLRRQLAEDQEMDWKDERAMEELMKKQKQLQEDLNELQEINNEKDERTNEFSPEEERLLEKQEQLQNLMEQVMSDELKEMYEEMQRLMEQMDPESMEQIQEQLDNMQVDQESLEKELDRALEQFKQLEYEVKMEEAIEDLKELAEKQAELAELTRNEEGPNDSLQAEQDSLNQAFEELQEELDALDKSNEELENPNSTMDREEERDSIEEKMNDSSDQLKQDKNKKASENQQSASEEMQQMAQQLESLMQKSSEEALEMDMDALRALLENIIDLSFDEEGLMEDLRSTSENDPAYVMHGQTQRRLKDDARMVEDSLFELSMRIPQLAPAVNREIGLVNHHMALALGSFGDRETDIITTNQQYVMTSFNNLALMLDDALQQMQQSMAEKQPGNGNCEKPGGNGNPKPSPSAGDLKKMQQSLGDRLEKMKEMMGEGANAGNSGKQKRQLSKELAQMAAQQAALRQMAEKKAQEMNGDGSGDGNQMNDIAKEMEELERDLVNKDVTIETLERQQQLLVRLLKAENAEMTRGEDDKRKSRAGDQNLATEPAPLLDYLEQKNREAEWLRTIPLELDAYYRDRVNEYFNNLDLTKPDSELLPQ